MIPKNNRLNKEEFDLVFKKGKGYKNDKFFIKVLKNDLGHFRTGVGTTKKLTKKAVERNYYKRLLKQMAKNILSGRSVSYDVVIIANEGVEGKKLNELQKELHALIQRANILDN